MSSDAKSYYSQVAKDRIADGVSNETLQKAIQRAFERKKSFQQNWATIELSSFVEKFAPNANRYVKGVKIYFDSPATGLTVIADLSGYCRLVKKINGQKKFVYLDINGNDVSKGKLEIEKQLERSHFLIKKI